MKLRVASPCEESWGDMTGDERVRLCDRCDLRVYNLSELTETEAVALMNQFEGRSCVRFYQRKDGTVLTKDCPAARRQGWKEVAAMAGLSALLLTVLTALAVGARGSSIDNPNRPKWLVTIRRWLGQDDPPVKYPVMGVVCPAPAPRPARTPKGT